MALILARDLRHKVNPACAPARRERPMHPFLTQQLATERRVRLLHEAERARLVRSAKRSPTARLRVRALEPTDIDRLWDLYDGLSPRSRFLRFMSPIQRLPDSAVEYLGNIDHDRHEAIGAFDRTGLVASAHWFRLQLHPRRADIAIEVTDRYQCRGVGSRLLRLLGRRARAQGIVEFGATMRAENSGAIALIQATGWPLASTRDGAELTVAMAIDAKG
jgi:GNAT superfamily N-acetyltransferase